MTKLLTCTAAFAAVLGTLAAAGNQSDDRPLAIRDATIETAGAAGRIERGHVIVRGGKIEAVGTDVQIPDNARVIDARGMTILPGIVDPHSRAGLRTETPTLPTPPTTRGRFPGGFPTLPTSPATFTRVADQFYPYQPVYRQLTRSGATTLSLVPTGLGQAATVRLAPDQPEQMMLAPDGLLFVTVSNQTSSLRLIRESLKRAKSPGTPPAAKPADESAESKTEPREPREGQGPPGPPDRAAASSMPLWIDVVAGKRVLLANPANSAAIAHLLSIVEEYPEVKLAVVASGPTIFETLSLLQRRKPRIILEPSIDLQPNTRNRINVPRAVHEAGLDFAFTMPSNPEVWRATQDVPLFPVAYLVRAGLPRTVALQALTRRPAELIGLGDRLGSIEPKKDANLLIFSGDPLDPTSRLRRVIVEGRTVHEN